MSKLIALTDESGEIRWFKEKELESQLAGADMSASGALKKATRNYLDKVVKMRIEQKRFFSAQPGSDIKAEALMRSKNIESEVDNMSKSLNKILDILK